MGYIKTFIFMMIIPHCRYYLGISYFRYPIPDTRYPIPDVLHHAARPVVTPAYVDRVTSMAGTAMRDGVYARLLLSRFAGSVLARGINEYADGYLGSRYKAV